VQAATATIPALLLSCSVSPLQEGTCTQPSRSASAGQGGGYPPLFLPRRKLRRPCLTVRPVTVVPSPPNPVPPVSVPVLPPGASPADKRFNFAACLTDAVGWPLGMAFFSTATILPVLMRRLGAGNLEVGALPALYNLLVFLPGFFVAGYVGRLPRARGFLLGFALVERLALLALVWLVPLWGWAHPGWLLSALFVCIAVHAGAMGINQPSYYLVIGKCIPAQWRGRLFGYAGGVAGLLGIGVDHVLRHLLSGPGAGFPDGYSRGFLLGFVILVASVLPLGIVREPRGLPPPTDTHSGHYGRDCLKIWREQPGFRRFLRAQIALQLAALALPFFVLYASQSLHAGISAVAGYTATLILAGSFGSLGWGAWADKGGNKAVVLASAGCAVGAALLALAAPSSLAFYAVFALSALASAGIGMCGTNMVMEYAQTSDAIPLYTAFYNAVTALPRAAAPLLGGWIADSVHGYRPVFALSLLLSLAGLLLMFRADEPRHAARPAPAAEA